MVGENPHEAPSIEPLPSKSGFSPWRPLAVALGVVFLIFGFVLSLTLVTILPTALRNLPSPQEDYVAPRWLLIGEETVSRAIMCPVMGLGFFVMGAGLLKNNKRLFLGGMVWLAGVAPFTNVIINLVLMKLLILFGKAGPLVLQ